MKKTKLITLIACIAATMSSASAMESTSSSPTPTPDDQIKLNTYAPAPSAATQPKPTTTVSVPSATTQPKTDIQATISIIGGDVLPTIIVKPAVVTNQTLIIKTAVQPKLSIPVPENIHGLNNIGASCYLNSLVQILYHTKTIHQYISSNTFEKTEMQNLKLLFEDMDKTAKSAVVNPAARYAGMKFHRGSDDPQYVFLDHFACDLEKIIDLDSEMDNPVLLDGTPQIDKTKEKNKPSDSETAAESTKDTPAATSPVTEVKKDTEPAPTATTPITEDTPATPSASTPSSEAKTSPLITPPERTPKGKTAVGMSIATCKSGGHYYAIVKENGKWFIINDSSVCYIGNTFESAVSHVRKAGHLFRFISYE